MQAWPQEKIVPLLISKTGLRVLKFIKNALREIILIVLSILIALQINNWNEGQKSKKELQQILKTIETDLNADLAQLTQIKRVYEVKIELMDSVLNGKMKEEDLYACKRCIGVNTSYNNFVNNTRGFEMLKSYNVKTSSVQDSLFVSINSFYETMNTYLESVGNSIETDVMETVKWYRDETDWYTDFLKGTVTKEMIDFVYKTPKSINRLAYHRLMVKNNYLSILSIYKDSAEALIEKIKNERK